MSKRHLDVSKLMDAMYALRKGQVKAGNIPCRGCQHPESLHPGGACSICCSGIATRKFWAEEQQHKASCFQYEAMDGLEIIEWLREPKDQKNRP